MHRSLHIASLLGCASLLLAGVASALVAQATPDRTADVLGRMRADLSARRYTAVITQANGLLESARAISTPQRIELWQLLAAAYYPRAPQAQQPDSARLPLAALIRLAPDIKIAREFSWPGLDELTERTRAGSFAVLTRPLAEYTLGAGANGDVAAVAARRTRFLLISVDDATGRTVVHDTSAYVTAAALRLRTHDAHGPIFTNGLHHLYVWAYDLNSGDSVRIAHRVRALRSDLPPPIAGAAVAPDPVALPAVVAEPPPARRSVATHRSSMLWGGLALAAATAVIAQEARPDDGLRSAFRVDARAFVVGATMAGAAVVNFFTGRTLPRSAAPAAVAIPLTPPPPPPLDTYRVRLTVDPPER